jgi:hypothetical protein
VSSAIGSALCGRGQRFAKRLQFGEAFKQVQRSDVRARSFGTLMHARAKRSEQALRCKPVVTTGLRA